MVLQEKKQNQKGKYEDVLLGHLIFLLMEIAKDVKFCISVKKVNWPPLRYSAPSGGILTFMACPVRSTDPSGLANLPDTER